MVRVTISARKSTEQNGVSVPTLHDLLRQMNIWNFAAYWRHAVEQTRISDKEKGGRDG
jgi:hypothetical protein